MRAGPGAAAQRGPRPGGHPRPPRPPVAFPFSRVSQVNFSQHVVEVKEQEGECEGSGAGHCFPFMGSVIIRILDAFQCLV